MSSDNPGIARWRAQKIAAAEHYPHAKAVLKRHKPDHLLPIDEVDEAYNIYGAHWAYDMLLWAWDIASWVTAEDVVIEVIAKVYFQAVVPGHLDVSRCDGKPYLRQAIRHHLSNTHAGLGGRSREHETQLPDNVIAFDDSADTDLLDYEQQQEMEQLIHDAGLTDREGAFFRYCYIANLPDRLTATLLGTTPGAIYMLRSRTLSKIKHHLESNQPDAGEEAAS
jgi:DNA-directed RNA polymerase specialized sigma24 family protein